MDLNHYDGFVFPAVGTIASSLGGSITTGITANTKGSFAVLHPNIPCDIKGIHLDMLVSANANQTSNLIDIGVDYGQGVEILVPNIQQCRGNTGYSTHHYFPISAGAGGNIVGRSQGGVAGQPTWATVMLVATGWSYWRAFSFCNTYGQNLTTSRGVSVDPGGTANTKGAWSEITAACDLPVSAIVFELNNLGATGSYPNATYRLDIGVGPSGSESVLVGDIPLQQNSSDGVLRPDVHGPFFVSIPGGTRIVARAQSTTNSAAARTFDIMLHCFS